MLAVSDVIDSRPNSRNGFEISVIFVLPLERDDVEALLDAEYEIDGLLYGQGA